MSLENVELPSDEVKVLINILRIVSNSGINDLLIESHHDHSILSGIHNDNTIILYCRYDLPEVLSCVDVIFPNIKMILSRIKSVKDAKCTACIDEDTLELQQVQFDTGDGTVSIPCADFQKNKKNFPRMEVVPQEKIHITKSKEQLSFLSDQLKSFGQRGRKAGKFSFYNYDDDLIMSLDDGENNYYTEVLSIKEELESTYPLPAVYLLFKEAYRVEKQLNLQVMDTDFLQITIDNITLHVVPFVE